MKIMEQLYCGMIDPCEKIVPDDKKYREARRQAEAIAGELSAKLEPKDYEKVEELYRVRLEAEDILAREYFKYGLSLGMRLMQEAYELSYL
ncbi:MAG: hypothetical protein LIO92_04985 [Clostridiales bacterium]|nr:hypothetical protein [Clostridiales bacterium]